MSLKHSAVLTGLKLAARATRPFNYRGLQRLGWILNAPGRTEVALKDGGRLCIRLADGYWLGALDPAFEYERDIASALEAAWRAPGITFLDCGANIGYWSARASTVIPGRVIAVEASPSVFTELKVNAQLNGFKAINRAIWSKSCEAMEIVTHDQRHAGGSLVDRTTQIGKPGYSVESVMTCTIDELAPDGPVVIKLDVEGAELAAIEGASRSLDRGALLVYEDHGSDPHSKVTAALLDRGLRVWTYAPSFREIKSPKAISQLKTDHWRGYNFVAAHPSSQLCPSDLSA